MKIIAVACGLVALLSLPGIWNPGWKFYLVVNLIIDLIVIFACYMLKHLAGD